MDSVEFQLAKLTYFNGPPFLKPTCLCQLPTRTYRSSSLVIRKNAPPPEPTLTPSSPFLVGEYPRGIPCAHSWHASAAPSHHVGSVSYTNSPWLKATRMQAPAPYLPPNVVHQSFPALGPKPLAWKMCWKFIFTDNLRIRFHNGFKSWFQFHGCSVNIMVSILSSFLVSNLNPVKLWKALSRVVNSRG